MREVAVTRSSAGLPARVSSAASSWPVWLLLAVALTLALVAGSGHSQGAQSTGQRVASIASDIRCPSCSGLSAEDSNASTAVAIRNDIRARVRAGQSDSQIEDFLVSRYGSSILLRPAVSGISATVWVVPLAAVALAFAILGTMFWARRRRGVAAASEADHDLVRRALDKPGSRSPSTPGSRSGSR